MSDTVSNNNVNKRYKSSDWFSSAALFSSNADSSGNVKASLFENPDSLPSFIQQNYFMNGANMLELAKPIFELYQQTKKQAKMQDSSGNPISEDKTLLHSDSMPIEDVDKELKSYQLETANKTDNEKRAQVMFARMIRNEQDAGSQDLDYKTGTYNQGAKGTCSLLSAIRNLSEDEVKKFMQVENDEQGNPKGYSIKFPGDKDGKRIFVSKEEIEADSVSANGTTFKGFSRGDYTARAIEMAYFKRFGDNAVGYKEETDDSGKLTGYTLTFPGDTESVTLSSEEVEKGEVTIDGKTYKIDTPNNVKETRAYQMAYAKRHNLAPVGDQLASPYWTIKDENNNGNTAGLDLDTASNLFRSPDNKLKLIKNITEEDLETRITSGSIIGIDSDKCPTGMCFKNGSIVIAEHAYSLVKYDKTTKMAYLSNPHSSTTLIPVPLDDVTKYMSMSGL